MKHWYICWYDKNDKRIHVEEAAGEQIAECEQKYDEFFRKHHTNDVEAISLDEASICKRCIDERYAVWALDEERAYVTFNRRMLFGIESIIYHLCQDKPDIKAGYEAALKEFLNAKF